MEERCDRKEKNNSQNYVLSVMEERCDRKKKTIHKIMFCLWWKNVVIEKKKKFTKLSFVCDGRTLW